MTQLCDDYLKACEKGLILGKRKQPKKASTVSIDRGRIERHIKPLLGNIRVIELKRDDVERFMRDVAKGKSAADVRPHQRKDVNGHKGNRTAAAGNIVYSDTVKMRGRAIITGGRGTATRTIGLLGSILSYAVSEGVCTVNVARGIKTYGHGRRRMVLTPEQYRALGLAIEVAAARPDDAKAAAILRLIALTGLRRGEAVALKKVEANEAGRCIALADSKEGENVRPAGSPAFDLLRTLSRNDEDNPYVLATGRRMPTMQEFPKAWRRIFQGAENLPPGLTPHGLRHAYASVANELGFTEATIGALLGHSGGGKSTTSRYTHHVDAVLAAAADRVARRIDAMMTGRQADVVQLPTSQAVRS